MGTKVYDPDNRLPKTVLVLGNFDGLHKGHMALINRSKMLSKTLGIESGLFTFEPHPRFVLSHSPDVKLIFTGYEKKVIVDGLEIGYYIQYPFEPAVAGLEPEQFIRDIIVDKMNPHTVIIGQDYRFGKKRSGDAAYLKILGNQYNFNVEVIEKLRYKDREISSTWIREAVEKGDIELANYLLGREFFFLGKVCQGAKIGRTIGFPTANLGYTKEKILPPNGVYSSIIELRDRAYLGITNIGNKPTVNSLEKTIETHILDFDDDIYGEEIKVRLTRFIRSEQRFDSLELLKKQIEIDIRQVEIDENTDQSRLKHS